MPHNQNNHQHNQNNHQNVMNISCDNNTTFVQADPSNFRSVVQKLTGNESHSDKPPTFKLQERRHSTTKIENIFMTTIMSAKHRMMSSSSFLASPVSPLEMLTLGSTMEEEQEEERAIAEKRFYLHPNSPTPSHPPQLLPLFPLH